jgi:hypothetical protein
MNTRGLSHMGWILPAAIIGAALMADLMVRWAQ